MGSSNQSGCVRARFGFGESQPVVIQLVLEEVKSVAADRALGLKALNRARRARSPVQFRSWPAERRFNSAAASAC